jgi:hypothetical protein
MKISVGTLVILFRQPEPAYISYHPCKGFEKHRMDGREEGNYFSDASDPDEIMLNTLRPNTKHKPPDTGCRTRL